MEFVVLLSVITAVAAIWSFAWTINARANQVSEIFLLIGLAGTAIGSVGIAIAQPGADRILFGLASVIGCFSLLFPLLSRGKYGFGWPIGATLVGGVLTLTSRILGL